MNLAADRTVTRISRPEGKAPRRSVASGMTALWMIVIDDPEACETMPCTRNDVSGRNDMVDAEVLHGEGLIASPGGRATFNGKPAKRPIPGAWPCSGFDTPGRLLPAIGSAMLARYRGGCRDDCLPEAFPDVAKAGGIPGPKTCTMIQDVIFQQ